MFTIQIAFTCSFIFNVFITFAGMSSPPEKPAIAIDEMSSSTVHSYPIHKEHDDPLVMYEVDIVPDHRSTSIIEPMKTTTTASASPEKTRKQQRHLVSPGSDNTVVNVINSTKIVIKGLNVNAAAAAAAAVVANSSRSESPAIEQHNPQNLVKQSDPVVEIVKNVVTESKMNVTEEHYDQDLTASSTTAAPVLRTSTPKMNREFMLLQRTVTESKMLTEYMNDTDSRSRKAKRVSTAAAQRIADDASDNESVNSSRTSQSRGGAADRSRSRSLSRNRSPGSTQSTTTPEGRGPRRNMRSQNAEFSAKHQKFLKGIQHHQESDASDNSENEHDGERSSIPSMDEVGDKDIYPAPRVNSVIYVRRLCYLDHWVFNSLGGFGLFLLDLSSWSTISSVHHVQTILSRRMFEVEKCRKIK